VTALQDEAVDGRRLARRDPDRALVAHEPARVALDRDAHAGDARPRVDPHVGFARGSVWAAQSSRRRVTRLDARTGRRLATVRVGGNPSAGLVSGGRIYVPNHLEDTVSIISTATGRVRNVTVGNYPSALVDVGDDVWVANYGDGTVQTVPAQ